MVTPASIIDVISDQFGVARATVAMQDRMLVTSGHRLITGRGRAARGSPDGAAALLLAVAATPLAGPAIKETAVHYERYARLLATTPSGERATWQVKHLNKLEPGHSLHAAIAAIIVLFGEGITQPCDLFAGALPDANGISSDLSIDVELRAPMPSAVIVVRAVQRRAHATELRHPDDGLPAFEYEDAVRHECRVEYRPTYNEAEKYLNTLPRHPLAGRRSPDLSQTRTFTLATLANVAALFSDRVKL